MEPPGFKIDREFVMKSLGFAHNPESVDSVVPQETGDTFDSRMHFTYEDLFKAYLAGALDSHDNPTAKDSVLKQAADAYCKLIHSERDPEMFASLGSTTRERFNVMKALVDYNTPVLPGSEVRALQAPVDTPEATKPEPKVRKAFGTPVAFGREPTTEEKAEFKKKEFIDDY